MKKLLFFIFIFFAYLNANEVKNYIDFSSERSTWFFKKTNNNKIIFSDFYPPFDTSIKVDFFNPLMSFKLDSSYKITKNNEILLKLDDLKKLYAPYFTYIKNKDNLQINFIKYDKKVIGNFGKRNTKIEYIKKVYIVNIDKNYQANYEILEYEPFLGGRGIEFIEPNKIAHKINKNASINYKNDYINASELLKIFDIDTINEGKYIALQINNIDKVTINVEKKPSSKNAWAGGFYHKINPNYTWANYMNDIIDNKRQNGWKWIGIYLSNKDLYKDTNGEKLKIDINRIIPLAIYIPKNYDKNISKTAFILHGGTGNENASAYRLASREVYLDEYATKYNYVLVFPNGWTQNPMWMHRQALKSFEKSFDFISKNYPTKDIFLVGNSLGGRGTFDIAMRKPNMFKAIVVTAPAWGVKEHSVYKQNKYSLETIKNLPTLIGVSTHDSTFPFKLEVGSKKNPGWISKDIKPMLKNATYVVVENGNHTYGWASILDMIFEFLNDSLKDKNTNQINEKSTILSLSELKNIYKDRLKIYKIHSYDTNKNDEIEYYTMILDNNSVNFSIGKKEFRTDLNRYKEDVMKNDNDIDELKNAPTFSIAPYEKDGEIFINIKEILENFKK